MERRQPNKPVLIVVAGPSGTGKTTLSRQIASRFDLPLLNRDVFKEILFDTLGWSDRAWSRQLGAASYELLFYAAEELLKTRRSCILESNFTHEHNSARLLELIQRYGYFPLQILCRADPAVILERMHTRSGNGERHPGHVEQSETAGLDISHIPGTSAPLAIGGQLIELDTSDPAQLDYASLFAQLHFVAQVR